MCINGRILYLCGLCDRLREWSDIPLVTRKDTAIKSASRKLSEDIWTIVSCIKNKKRIPRAPTLSPSSRPISQRHNTEESQSRATHDNITPPTPPVQAPISSPSNTHDSTTPNPPIQLNPPVQPPALIMWILHPQEKWPPLFRER